MVCKSTFLNIQNGKMYEKCNVEKGRMYEYRDEQNKIYMQVVKSKVLMLHSVLPDFQFIRLEMCIKEGEWV